MQTKKNKLQVYLYFKTLFKSQNYRMKNHRILKDQTAQEDKQSANQRKEGELPFLALDMIAFERSSTPPTSLTIYSKCLLELSIVLHSLTAYMLLSSGFFNQPEQQIPQLLQTNSAGYLTAQVSLYILNLLLIWVIISNKQKKSNKVKLSILQRIVSYYFLLAEINLAATYFLAYVSFQDNLPPMITAAVVSLFQNVFLQNYCIKNQPNFKSCLLSSLIIKAAIIANFMTNCILVNYGTRMQFLCSSVFFGVFFLCWYLKAGYCQFLHKGLSVLQIIFCATFISLNCEFAIMIRNGAQSVNFVEWTIAFLLVSLYLLVYSKSKRLQLEQKPKNKNLKQYELSLHFLLQQSHSDLQMQNALVGMLADHWCSNSKCRIRERCKTRGFQPNSIVKEKQELLMFYLKCLYETALATDKTTQNMIDYCQFMISEFGNFSTHCLYLQELSIIQKNLGVLQMIKISKLKLLLQEQSDAFNKLLFGGRVHFVDILHADQNFDFIMTHIDRYCKFSVQVWQQALQKTVSITEWKEEIHHNSQLLVAIGQRWKRLSKYFYVNKYWKFVYLNYAYYLKNQQVKSRDFQRDDSTSKQLIQFSLDKTLKGVKDALFFDSNTTAFQAKLQAGSLVFKKTDKNFQKLTRFTQEQVINMPISMIQPQTLQDHDQRVCNMIQRGDTLNEGSYHVLGTHFLTKYGQKINAVVLFKLHIYADSDDGLIHFICVIVALGQTHASDQRHPWDIRQNHYERQQPISKQIGMLKLNTPSELNIFAKEESLKPTADYSESNRIVRVSRLLIAFVMCCLLFGLMLQNSEMSKSQNQIVQQNYMINAFRYPMALTINYVKKFLNLSDPSLVNPKIQSFTASLMQLSNDPAMTAMLSNPDINAPALYAPYIINSANKGLAYDQVDLFYVIYSSIITLSSYQTINRTGPEYVKLDSYLMQYHRMINGTKMHLHSQFTELIEQNLNHQIWMLLALSAAFLLAAAYLSYRVCVYYSKCTDLVTIILQFQQSQINDIIKYWRNVASSFHKLQKEKEQLEVFGLQVSLHSDEKSQNLLGDGNLQNKCKMASSSNQKIMLASGNEDIKISLNHRSKSIITGPSQKAQLRKIILILLLILLALLGLNISIPINSIIKIQSISALQNTGFDIFRYIPFTGELSYAISRAYYYQLYPNQTVLSYSLFAETLTNLQVMGRYQYVQSSQYDSDYLQQRKNYLFGNPCTYKPSVLQANKATMQNCLGLANGSLTGGISAFLRYTQPTISNYISGNLKLSLGQVNNISNIIAIVSYYFYDMTYTWLSELQGMVSTFSMQNLAITLGIMFGSGILYLVVMQWWFISKLRRDYILLKSIYEGYVPESILLKEKVVMQKFLQTGIIR